MNSKKQKIQWRNKTNRAVLNLLSALLNINLQRIATSLRTLKTRFLECRNSFFVFEGSFRALGKLEFLPCNPPPRKARKNLRDIFQCVRIKKYHTVKNSFVKTPKCRVTGVGVDGGISPIFQLFIQTFFLLFFPNCWTWRCGVGVGNGLAWWKINTLF